MIDDDRNLGLGLTFPLAYLT